MNKYAFMKKVCISAGVAVLFFAGVLTVRAQSELPLHRINTQGQLAPSHLEDSYNLSAIDLLNQRVLFLVQDSLWAYQLQQNRWKFLQPLKPPISDRQTFELVYDTTANRLLFWSESVGRVYQWKQGWEKPVRIDHSFDHQNQYHHTPLFDRSKGMIYAFGGYGLWQWQNMITRYAPEAKEWFIVSVKPDSPLPPPRTDAAGFLASGERNIYIIGGTGPSVNRQDDIYTERKDLNGLWRFSLEDNRWEKLGVINLPGLPGFKPYRTQYTNQMAKQAYDGKRGLFYFTMQTEQKSDYVPGIYCFDSRHSVVKRVIALHGQFRGQHSPLAFYYDPQRDRLLVFALLNLAKTRHRPIVVFEASHQTLHKAFSESDTNLLQRSGKRRILPGWAVLTAAGLVVILAGGAWFFRVRTHSPGKADASGDDRSARGGQSGNGHQQLTVGEEKIWLGPVPVEEIFEGKELQLLKLLVMRFQAGKPYLLTDEIEEALWRDQTNLDYTRKLRNKTLHNINRKFQEQLDLDESAVLVEGRRSDSDRRKMEYGLNPKWLRQVS